NAAANALVLAQPPAAKVRLCAAVTGRGGRRAIHPGRAGGGFCHGGRLCGDRLGDPGLGESGASEGVRRLLAQAEQADTAMAPAADMFEMGVKVQVLKRGTMFPMRAAKLYEL